MNILLVEKNKMTRPLYLFFDDISEGLYLKIYNKFQSYVQYGDVYHGKHLKTLNSKIWKYKGIIYKLRIDHGNESARALFSKSKDGNLKIIHAFLKSTRKTPAKEAQQAKTIYQMLESLETVLWDKQSIKPGSYLTSPDISWAPQELRSAMATTGILYRCFFIIL